MAQWYVKSGETTYGPFVDTKLKSLADQKKISPSTVVRRGADGNWIPAGRIKGLFQAASAPNTESAQEVIVAEVVTSVHATKATPGDAANSGTSRPSDSIATECPNGHNLQAAAKLAGKKGKCPKCGATFTVPEHTASVPLRHEQVATINANYTFREMVGLTKFLGVLLGLGVVMAVVSLLSSLMQTELLSRGTFSEAEGQANDSRELIIGLFQSALYLFTAVIFGCWIVRANKNVRALGAVGLRITPGWAVGYFFIPIVNFWKPLHAMKDLWQASHNPASWTTTIESRTVSAWWNLWLVSIVLAQISFRATTAAKDLKGLQMATYVQLISQAVDIPLCLVAIALVTQIANAQQTHVETRT